jgi:L-rhamnose mutarotase
MQRVAFQLRIRTDKLEEYDRVHQNVWPELLAELDSFGVREYSIFRRGQQLFLYMRVPDFESLLVRLEQSEINQRWQDAMAPLFEAVPDLQAGETFAMMKEVFYMQGSDTEYQAGTAQPGGSGER